MKQLKFFQQKCNYMYVKMINHLLIWLISVRLYHHTSAQGGVEILKSQTIRQSTDTANDARYGQAAYLTTKGVDSSRHDIAHNNYDGAYKANYEKTQAAISVDVPRRDVSHVRTGDGRDIYTHKGDINLSNKTHALHVRQSDGTTKTYTN